MTLFKSYSFIKLKYLCAYIDKGVTAHLRSTEKMRHRKQEMGIPPYHFAKVGLDLSGPYLTILSGNRYIVYFIDWHGGWVDAFST